MKNRLKELRQLHKRSQSDLARELGVSRQAVNGFESCKFDPSLDMAFKIANLFNVAIEDVFIYEAKSMQTVLERVKNFFGLEFVDAWSSSSVSRGIQVPKAENQLKFH